MTMRTIVLTMMTAALIAASAAQGVSAAARHPAHKAAQVTASKQFRNANNAVAAAPQQPVWYSGGYSAPAGH
jgi:hypothetical protein